MEPLLQKIIRETYVNSPVIVKPENMLTFTEHPAGEVS